MTSRLQIVIAQIDHKSRETIHRAVIELGHDVCGEAVSAAVLDELCRSKRPDLAIVDARLLRAGSGDADSPRSAQDAVPIVMTMPYGTETFVEQTHSADVLACVAEPVTHVDLMPAIDLAHRHFQRRRQLDAQRRTLKQELDLIVAGATVEGYDT